MGASAATVCARAKPFFQMISWYEYQIIKYDIIEGSLEVKLPTVWKDEKQRWKEAERREE